MKKPGFNKGETRPSQWDAVQIPSFEEYVRQVVDALTWKAGLGSLPFTQLRYGKTGTSVDNMLLTVTIEISSPLPESHVKGNPAAAAGNALRDQVITFFTGEMENLRTKTESVLRPALDAAQIPKVKLHVKTVADRVVGRLQKEKPIQMEVILP